MRFFFVFLLTLLLTACGGGGTDTSNSNCKAGSCEDASGDAAFALIDMQKLKVTVDDEKISVDIELLDIPDLLTYNNASLPLNASEYDWGISFDVDRDNTRSNNIDLRVTYFKNLGTQDGNEAQDPLLAFTQHTIWLVDSVGNFSSNIGQLATSQNSNIITMTVRKNQDDLLSSIDSSTPFKFRTLYRIENTKYEDFYPDNGDYTN